MKHRIPLPVQTWLLKATLWLLWLLCFGVVLVVALKARRAHAQIGVAEQPMFAMLSAPSCAGHAALITNGLIVRLESDDFDSYTNGAPVSNWVDKVDGRLWTNSGNPPLVDTNRPDLINGHKTLRFDSYAFKRGLRTGAFFDSTYTNGIEYMAVFRLQSWPPVAGSFPELGGGSPARFNQPGIAAAPHIPERTTGNFYECFGRNNQQLIGRPVTDFTNHFVVYNVSSSGTNASSTNALYQAWLDCTVITNQTANYTYQAIGVEGSYGNYYSIGYAEWFGTERYWMNSYIAAIYAWRRTLTVAERIQMRGYIRDVWGVGFPAQ